MASVPTTKLHEVFSSPLTVALVVVLSILAIGTAHQVASAEASAISSRVETVEAKTKTVDEKLDGLTIRIVEIQGDQKLILYRLDENKR